MEADELLKRIRELEEGQAELKREVARLAPERPSSRDRGGAPPASSSFSRDRPFPALLPPPSRRAIAVHPRASLLLHRQSRAGLSNRHCRRILQSLGQAVHVLSLEGKLLYWNRYAEHLYGYSASEAIGRDCVELLCDPGAFDAANGIIGNVLMGKCWRGNFPVKNKSGERFTILANNTPFYDDDGSLLGLICLSLDVLTLEGIICPSTSPKFYPQSPNIPFQVKVSSRVRSRMKTGQKCDEQYGSGCEDLESEEYDLKEASTLVGDVTPGAFAAVENFPRKLRKSNSADQNEGEDGGCWENNIISRLHDKQENDQSHQGVPILETAIIPDCQDTQYTQDSKYVPSGSWWTFDNNCTTSTVSGSMSSSCSAAERVDYEADCLDYEILWEDLVIGEQVGQGSCGIVYHALWYGSDVAVKVFSKQQYSEDMILTFRQEVSLMKKLRHPNIILFMGAVASLERLCIVTEYLPRGSLLSLLQKSTAKLDPRRRVRMAIDIAKGMNYLHSCSPPVVHRDLKSSNLLVDENWTVKVADFGLSRLKLQTFLSSRTGKGTAQWMAPEVLRNEPSNEKSDVYSYGVVLWELSTQKIPWGDLNPVQVVAAVGFMDRHLEIPSDTDHQWASMIESCWESDPQRRPSFQELLVRLRELQKQCIVQVQTRRKAQKDKVNVKDQ